MKKDESLKVEMFNDKKFQVSTLSEQYINYYNKERISVKLKGKSSVQYRTLSQTI